MFRFTKKVFAAAMKFLNCSLLKVNSLKCVLMNNQD